MGGIMLISNKKIKLLFILFIATIGVFFGFKFIIPLFAPFIIAYFFAWSISPLVRFLHDKIKMPKLTSAILSLVFVGGVFFMQIISKKALDFKQQAKDLRSIKNMVITI